MEDKVTYCFFYGGTRVGAGPGKHATGPGGGLPCVIISVCAGATQGGGGPGLTVDACEIEVLVAINPRTVTIARIVTIAARFISRYYTVAMHKSITKHTRATMSHAPCHL